MELIQNSSEGTFLLYWLLDHKHFLLFSFFTKEELEGTLSWVSHRFNEKVMSILLWRDMMSQISGINTEIEESETVAGDLIENSDLEQEKLNDLSCPNFLRSHTHLLFLFFQGLLKVIETLSFMSSHFGFSSQQE